MATGKSTSKGKESIPDATAAPKTPSVLSHFFQSPNASKHSPILSEASSKGKELIPDATAAPKTPSVLSQLFQLPSASKPPPIAPEASSKGKELIPDATDAPKIPPALSELPQLPNASTPSPIASVATATDGVAGLAVNGAGDAGTPVVGTPVGTPSSGQGAGSTTSGNRSPSLPRPEVVALTSRLLYCASKGDVEGIKHLLDDDIDVNASDYDKRTGLHLAASEGQLEAVKLLLERGAEVNAIDRWGNTPLYDAKYYDFPEVSNLLEKWNGRALGNRREVEVVPEWEIDPAEINLSQGQLIGKGAFGEIRRLSWRGTPVAVKMILPALSGDAQIVKEFRDEVELLTKLRHPNIVQFLGAVTRTTPLMLITEYLSGGDLHMIIREGPISPENCIKYALDIARGMNYLHNRKPESIIHRDLKPRNLLKDGGGHLKVADFGLSKFIKAQDVHDAYKMTGETGSYRYMAPEVYRHEAYDKSVDVYSFAIIVYEMFEGRSPFYTKPAEEVAWYVAYDNVRPSFKAKTYIPGMRELIEECWSNIPSRRPSFSNIIERLEVMQKKLPKVAKSVHDGDEIKPTAALTASSSLPAK